MKRSAICKQIYDCNNLSDKIARTKQTVRRRVVREPLSSLNQNFLAPPETPEFQQRMADAQRTLVKHFAEVKQAKSDKLKAKQAQKRAAAAAQGLPSPTPKLRVKYMKILPQAVDEDGEKEPLTWYHRRMNQGERVLKLTNLYAEFQRIIKRQVAYHFDQYNNQWEELPVHLLDEIKDL